MVDLTRAAVTKEPSGAVIADPVALEEPLEIRVEGETIAVTLRSPGHDLDLVAGWLLAEGVIDGADDLHALAHVDDPADPQGNTVDVVLSAGVPAARRSQARRELYASSACGVCGRQSVDALLQRFSPISTRVRPAAEFLLSLPPQMRAQQHRFNATGGVHAAALFDGDGALRCLREDVGRHNAVDKVVGWALRDDRVPLDGCVLLTSGRLGFEIVHKALAAGIPCVAAVGAPTSMAVDLAARGGVHLVGFLRDDRFNRYDGLVR